MDNYRFSFEVIKCRCVFRVHRENERRCGTIDQLGAETTGAQRRGPQAARFNPQDRLRIMGDPNSNYNLHFWLLCTTFWVSSGIALLL